MCKFIYTKDKREYWKDVKCIKRPGLYLLDVESGILCIYLDDYDNVDSSKDWDVVDEYMSIIRAKTKRHAIIDKILK